MNALDANRDFYISILDLGKLGQVFQETNVSCSTASAMMEYLKTGPANVERIIRFNTVAGTSSDVTAHMAGLVWTEIGEATERFHDVPDFVKAHHPLISTIIERFNVAEVTRQREDA